MKILMLNYEFPPIGGGGGQAHRALLQQYAGRPDLEVDVLTSAPKPGLFMEQIGRQHPDLQDRHSQEEPASLAQRRGRRMAPQGRSVLSRPDQDGPTTTWSTPSSAFPTGWLCYRTARRLPYIISLRGSDVPGANARLQLEYKILGPLVFKPIWKKASALVACSEGLKARALKFLPSAEIEVIPNGVDLEQFHPAHETGLAPGNAAANPRTPRCRFALQAGSQLLRLLTVGRLSATKRLPLLIETVALLRSQGCKVHLTVVGGGALESELRRLLSEQDLRDAVTLTGRREAEDMPEMYRQHDVFVSASMQEGMSNAMLEAMASGLPIVTTRCEGVDELISNNGIVVEEPTPAALAEAVRGSDRQAPDPAKPCPWRRGRRPRASAGTPSRDRYLDLYTTTLSKGGR